MDRVHCSPVRGRQTPVWAGECERKQGVTMADELKSIANWAKELGISEKKLKDAVKAAGVEPDGKKGICALYTKASIEKARKAIR